VPACPYASHSAPPQRMVMAHVGRDTILVGHALDNDLRALKV
jgi:hypothetical protein